MPKTIIVIMKVNKHAESIAARAHNPYQPIQSEPILYRKTRLAEEFAVFRHNLQALKRSRLMTIHYFFSSLYHQTIKSLPIRDRKYFINDLAQIIFKNWETFSNPSLCRSLELHFSDEIAISLSIRISAALWDFPVLSVSFENVYEINFSAPLSQRSLIQKLFFQKVARLNFRDPNPLITKLFMRNCRCTYSPQLDFTQLINLKLIEIVYSSLTICPKFSQNQVQLSQIDLQYNHLSQLDSQIFSLPNLEQLNLNNNMLIQIPSFQARIGQSFPLLTINLLNNQVFHFVDYSPSNYNEYRIKLNADNTTYHFRSMEPCLQILHPYYWIQFILEFLKQCKPIPAFLLSHPFMRHASYREFLERFALKHRYRFSDLFYNPNKFAIPLEIKTESYLYFIWL